MPAEEHLWQELMHRCTDRFREGLAKVFWAYIRWKTAGKAPPSNANHVTKARGSDGHTAHSDDGITRVFAEHYHRLGCPVESDAQEIDEDYFHHVTARVAEFAELSHEPVHADDVLDAVPSVAEIDRALKQFACHKAATSNGLVNELLNNGGLLLRLCSIALSPCCGSLSVYHSIGGLPTLSSFLRRETVQTPATTAASPSLMSSVSTTP